MSTSTFLTVLFWWYRLCRWLPGIVCMFSACLCRSSLGTRISSHNPNTHRSCQAVTVNFPQVWIDKVFPRLSPKAYWDGLLEIQSPSIWIMSERWNRENNVLLESLAQKWLTQAQQHVIQQREFKSGENSARNTQNLKNVSAGSCCYNLKQTCRHKHKLKLGAVSHYNKYWLLCTTV